jgi:hypothetical protein
MEKKLAYLLQILAKAEMDIEAIRHSLAGVASANLKEMTFELVDTSKRGTISTIELTRFFEKHKAQVEQDEVKMIIEYYDIKRQGKWDLETFHKAIAPRTKPDNSPYWKPPTKVEERKRMEDELVNFFLKELDLIRKTHNPRLQLHGTVATNSFSFYQMIDLEEEGDFRFKDFDAFLVKQGLLPSRVEIEAIMHRGARSDPNCMTYVEFERYILPNVVNKKVLAYNPEPEYMYNMVKESYRTEKTYEKHRPDDPNKINPLSHYDPMFKYEQGPSSNNTTALLSTQPFTAFAATNFSNTANSQYRAAITHYSTFTKEQPRDNRLITGSEILSTTATKNWTTDHHSAFDASKKTTHSLPLKYDKIYPHATTAEPFYKPAAYYERYPYSTPNYPETYYHGPSSPIREKSLAETYPVHMYGNHPHTIQPNVILDLGYKPYTSYSKYESPMRFTSQLDATSAPALNYKSQTSKPNSAFPISGPKPHYYYKVYDRFPADQYYHEKETKELIAKYQPRSSPEKENQFGSSPIKPYYGSKMTSPIKASQTAYASPSKYSKNESLTRSFYRSQTPDRSGSAAIKEYVTYNGTSKAPIYTGSSEFSKEARQRRQSVNNMLRSSHDRSSSSYYSRRLHV